MASSKDAVTERSSSSLRRTKKLLVNNQKIGETELFHSSLCMREKMIG